ncbi:MAG: hypothetical protein M9909_05945 [Thermomicrobiales bacterium]|nr:hypothetical protein [Thermomicrobiales bacterium]
MTDTLQNDLQVAAGETLGADNAAEGGVLEEILRAGILDRLVFVRRDRDQMTGDRCFLDRVDAAGTSELDGRHRAREDDVIPQW